MKNCSETYRICDNISCKICYNKSFASYNKKTNTGKLIIDCYNQKKNNYYNIKKIYRYSSKKYWFKCDKCMHDFKISTSKINRSRWCPYCGKHKLCGDSNCNICFDRSLSSFTDKTKKGKLKIECIDLTDNKGTSPINIHKGSNKNYQFICDICLHKFKCRIAHITGKKKVWCPYCSKPTQKICDSNKCDICYNNSFASYDGKTSLGKLKTKCWDCNKNNVTPRDIISGTHKKYWFNCDICKHDFETGIVGVINNTWCPYCSGNVICMVDSCSFCFDRSFASYKKKTSAGKLIIDCWDINKNEPLLPRNIFLKSKKKFWFNCDICQHKFNGIISCIASKNVWCPYCSGNTICINVDCDTCFTPLFI